MQGARSPPNEPLSPTYFEMMDWLTYNGWRNLETFVRHQGLNPLNERDVNEAVSFIKRLVLSHKNRESAMGQYVEKEPAENLSNIPDRKGKSVLRHPETVLNPTSRPSIPQDTAGPSNFTRGHQENESARNLFNIPSGKRKWGKSVLKHPETVLNPTSRPSIPQDTAGPSNFTRGHQANEPARNLFNIPDRKGKSVLRDPEAVPNPTFRRLILPDTTAPSNFTRGPQENDEQIWHPIRRYEAVHNPTSRPLIPQDKTAPSSFTRGPQENDEQICSRYEAVLNPTSRPLILPDITAPSNFTRGPRENDEQIWHSMGRYEEDLDEHEEYGMREDGGVPITTKSAIILAAEASIERARERGYHIPIKTSDQLRACSHPGIVNESEIPNVFGIFDQFETFNPSGMSNTSETIKPPQIPPHPPNREYKKKQKRVSFASEYKYIKTANSDSEESTEIERVERQKNLKDGGVALAHGDLRAQYSGLKKVSDDEKLGSSGATASTKDSSSSETGPSTASGAMLYDFCWQDEDIGSCIDRMEERELHSPFHIAEKPWRRSRRK